MEKFTQLTGVAAPLPIINIDTDMIIPKQYLKTIKRTGLGSALFSEMRYNEDGSENPDFVLNKPAYRKASIIVAGDNFGCGSSREHAPWALLDFGIRCVISTSFADIFYNNCFKNGILPIQVTPEQLKLLLDDAERGSQRHHFGRSRDADDFRARRRQHPFRHRPLAQAHAARRARRHRNDDEGRRRDFGLRAADAAEPPLALRAKGDAMVRRISTGSPFEASFGYSRAVIDGEQVHVSGTTGYDYASMTMPDDAGAQAANALATIERTLGEAAFQPRRRGPRHLLRRRPAPHRRGGRGRRPGFRKYPPRRHHADRRTDRRGDEGRDRGRGPDRRRAQLTPAAHRRRLADSYTATLVSLIDPTAALWHQNRRQYEVQVHGGIHVRRNTPRPGAQPPR